MFWNVFEKKSFWGSKKQMASIKILLDFSTFFRYFFHQVGGHFLKRVAPAYVAWDAFLGYPSNFDFFQNWIISFIWGVVTFYVRSVLEIKSLFSSVWRAVLTDHLVSFILVLRALNSGGSHIFLCELNEMAPNSTFFCGKCVPERPVVFLSLSQRFPYVFSCFEPKLFSWSKIIFLRKIMLIMHFVKKELFSCFWVREHCLKV